MDDLNPYWSNIVKKIKPYIPGEQPKDRSYVKLNTNENPYPPSPEVIYAIKCAADADLRLYPDPDSTELREICAKYYGVSKDNIFTGNGSDEILAFSFQAFFEPGKPVLFPDITYTFYPVYAELYNLDYRTVPLDEDFNILPEKFCAENSGIILPNPNAPTGKYLSLDAIKGIIDNNLRSVVIIDEAYIDFGGESVLQFINRCPNLLVVRTLSKSHSLAGLRVGFAIGDKSLVTALERIKNSFNSYTLDRLALAGAKAALKDAGYYEQTKLKIVRTRQWVTESLQELGFIVIDSKANFIFTSCPEIAGEVLFKRLREKGILVRFFDKPRIKNFVRVSIGTDDEMEKFLNAVKQIL